MVIASTAQSLAFFVFLPYFSVYKAAIPASYGVGLPYDLIIWEAKAVRIAPTLSAATER